MVHAEIRGLVRGGSATWIVKFTFEIRICNSSLEREFVFFRLLFAVEADHGGVLFVDDSADLLLGRGTA